MAIALIFEFNFDETRTPIHSTNRKKIGNRALLVRGYSNRSLLLYCTGGMDDGLVFHNIWKHTSILESSNSCCVTHYQLTIDSSSRLLRLQEAAVVMAHGINTIYYYTSLGNMLLRCKFMVVL